MPTTPYNQGIFRTQAASAGPDALVPQPLTSEIIQMLPTECATLQLAKQMQMSTTTSRMPVLSALPSAYFVNQTVPDSGLKQTTNMLWSNVNLIVEEIAAIVPIPDSYLADVNVPLWDEVKPRMVEAIAKVIDSACLFDVGRPATWSQGIIPAAIAAGNAVSASGSADLPQAVAKLAEQVTKEGFTDINGWAVRPGFKWRLMQTRSGGATQVPIYEPNLQDARGGSLYGYPMREVTNGAWDPTLADLLLGDWNMAIVGMRQDMTFKMFDQGIISDASGAVVWNAMQNDGVAMRVVIRLAFATANPVTTLRRGAPSTRYPFGVLSAPAGQLS